MRPADALSGCVESSNEEAERKAIVCPCSHPTCRVEKLLAHHAEQTSRRGLLRQVSRTTSLWAAEWQHDLSASHGKFGDVLVEQGNLPDDACRLQDRTRHSRTPRHGRPWKRWLVAAGSYAPSRVAEIAIRLADRASALTDLRGREINGPPRQRRSRKCPVTTRSPRFAWPDRRRAPRRNIAGLTAPYVPSSPR